MTIGATVGANKGRPAPKALLIDLDDTLYRVPAIPAAVRKHIEGERFALWYGLYIWHMA
jgi:hypothetical protein